jgi:hypothetical protein
VNWLKDRSFSLPESIITPTLMVAAGVAVGTAAPEQPVTSTAPIASSLPSVDHLLHIGIIVTQSPSAVRAVWRSSSGSNGLVM